MFGYYSVDDYVIKFEILEEDHNNLLRTGIVDANYALFRCKRALVISITHKFNKTKIDSLPNQTRYEKDFLFHSSSHTDVSFNYFNEEIYFSSYYNYCEIYNPFDTWRNEHIKPPPICGIEQFIVGSYVEIDYLYDTNIEHIYGTGIFFYKTYEPAYYQNFEFDNIPKKGRFELRSWYTNGQKKSVTPFFNKCKCGMDRFWYKHGAKIEENETDTNGNYNDNYDKSGKFRKDGLRYEIPYETLTDKDETLSYRHGKAMWWNEYGKIDEVQVYFDGYYKSYDLKKAF